MKSLGIAFLVLFLSFLNLAASKELTLSSDIQKGELVKFIPHTGSGKFGSYLSLNLPYPPAKALYDQVQKSEGIKIKTRGEAHITVITPVEFDEILSPAGVSISEINAIAEEKAIQSSKFDIVCLGRATKGKLATYYVVVKSQDLLSIRSAVEELYLKKGGKADGFSASNFHPHITIGFTKRDLHESDGAIKDVKSCIGGLVID